MADPLKLFSMMNLSSSWRGIMLEPEAGFPIDGDLYAPEYYFAGSLTPVVVTFVPTDHGILVGFPMGRLVGAGM